MTGRTPDGPGGAGALPRAIAGIPADSIVGDVRGTGYVARMQGVVVHGRADGATAALRGVDLEVDPGTLTVLVGGPGSGSHTALLVMAGLLPVDDGEVEVAGVRFGADSAPPDPREQPRTWRSRVGYVPEHPAAVDSLTVAENLALPTTHAGPLADCRRVERLLRLLRLVQVGGRYPHELTEQQRRCLSLGEVLADAPDLLVVPDDLPPTADSEPGLARCLAELVELDGHTVVTTLSHRVLLCARMVEFAEGRVVRRH